MIYAMIMMMLKYSSDREDVGKDISYLTTIRRIKMFIENFLMIYNIKTSQRTTIVFLKTFWNT